MTLNLWEQKPEQWRIDHPDFQDVMKTTFAKGKITEFEKEEATHEDYVDQVKSRVKVELDDGSSSDYLPLFYKPKEKYWTWNKAFGDDMNDILAQEFDEENSCYKSAWQSFRAGDEVIVLKINDEPKAVLGFYDNCPRIGEQLIRLNDGYSRFTPAGAVAYLETIGPDGEPLQLLTEAEIIFSSSGSDPPSTPEDPSTWPRWGVTQECSEEGVGAGPCYGCGVYTSGYMARRIHLGTSYPSSWSTNVHKVFVGPYIILLVTIDFTNGGGGHIEEVHYWPTFEDLISPQEVGDYLLCTETISGGGEAYVIPATCYCAIYDPEKHKDISIESNEAGYPQCPEGFKEYDIDFHGLEGTTCKAYYRPHTKEELEAAGMWPEFEDAA